MNIKRKRKELKVEFDLNKIEIIETYSAIEYDRGGIGFMSTRYKLNPNLPTLLTTTTTINNLSSDSEISSPETPTLLEKKKKKPRLTVNTTCIDGPLFFTKLSTHHNKFIKDDDLNHFLVPITPLSNTPTFTF